MKTKKQNGYFQVVVLRADGSWADTRKYKTMNRAYDFMNQKKAFGYMVRCNWVNLSANANEY